MAFTINGTTGINLSTQPLTGSLPDANAPTGSVLQVVEGTFTGQVSSTSGTYADTGLSASITPSSTSNKILVFFTSPVLNENGTELGAIIVRNSTQITNRYKSGVSAIFASCTGIMLDSPATTSSTTYKIQFSRIAGSNIVYFGTLESPAVSRIVLMEVAA
jgi:hypothetical protein